MLVQTFLSNHGDKQFFEVIETREELKSQLKDILFDTLYCENPTGTWDDEDSSLWIEMKDGTEYYFDLTETPKMKRINAKNVKRVIYSNPGSLRIYGDVRIVKNAHYGDWETEVM